MPVFARLHIYLARLRVDRETVLEQSPDHESQEEQQERNRIHHQLMPETALQRFIIYIIDKIEVAQQASQEKHREAQHDVPWIQKGIQPMRGIAPLADYRHRKSGNGILGNREIAAIEESSHGRTQQKRPEKAVQDQENLVSPPSQKISYLALELVRDRLQDKAQQNQHPEPVSPSEAGAVEQREGSEETAPESNQRSEREFPFPPGGIDQKLAFHLVPPQFEQKGIAPLHKQKEYKNAAQKADDKPPVCL